MSGKYQAGRSLEYEVANLFREAGWDIIRGAGSKGDIAIGKGDRFKADLVVSKETPTNTREVWIVCMQCKRTKN